MPVKNRKQSAIHDKRHENGLAPPARKIAKDKLEDLLSENGHAIGTGFQLADITDSTVNKDARQLGPNGVANGSSISTHMAPSWKGSSDGGSEGPGDQVVESIVVDEAATGGGAEVHGGNVNGSGKADVSTSAPSLDMTASIIGTHPLQDAIAVLLVLLSLPPTALTLVQIAFAFMTFGSASGGWTINSLLTPTYWFHSHAGNPSLFTMAVTDMSLFVVMYMLATVAPMLGNILFDVSQCVMAMSLGGSPAAKGGLTHTLMCIFVVSLPHALRTSAWRAYAVDPLASLITKLNMGPLNHIPIFLSSNTITYSWPRRFLDSHIIAQGMVRVVRRWIDRQPGIGSAKKGDKGDPESATSTTTSIPVSGDSTADGARTTSSDGRPPGPPPAAKDFKEKSMSSGKKRRKQGNFVRSRQPVWAAIASTKIILSREIEHSQASTDAADAEAAEAQGLGDAKRMDDRVWITRIDQTEISFSAIMRALSTAKDEETTNGESHYSTGAAELKHMFVRVNGARWTHFEVREVDNIGDGTVTGNAFKGRVYGLTPSENFSVEFIDPVDGRIIHAAHLVTRSVVSTDTGSIATPQPQDPLRPSSPSTTLKKAIAAAENQLAESRARSRKARKDHRTANSGLKREVDGLESRLSTFSGTDERQRQRQHQFRQNIKQADESVAAMVLELEGLADIPQAEQDAYDSTRQQWEGDGARRATLREEFESSKMENERQLSVVRNENASVRQKREKLEARLGRLDQQRDGLSQTIAQIQNERARKDGHRAATLGIWQNKEQEAVRAVQFFEAQHRDLDARIVQIEQQIFYLDSGFVQPVNEQSRVSHSADGSLSALDANNRFAGFPNALYSNGTLPIHSRHNSERHKTRGRSSSMLSEISGFTDEETSAGAGPYAAVPAPSDPTIAGPSIPRNDSAGNGSAGSASVNGSQPKSPTPRLSPIGTEMVRGSPRQYHGM